MRPWSARVLHVCLLFVIALGVSPAWAQDEDEDSLKGLDEIVVTITKRAESLQEVAATISVFDADMIREVNIERIADAVALIPNVQIKGGANQSISIRGISQSFVSQSPVARHVNGVFKFNNESYTGQFYDLEDIQVARGPSGTIYGRNATAGAVDLRWKKPHSGWEVFGDVTLANTDRYHFRGGVNVPLLGEGDERLMARVVVQREVHDGWVDNELTTRRNDPDRGDDTFVRASFRSVLSEDTEAIVRGFWHLRKDGTISSTPILTEFPNGLLQLPPPLPVFELDPFQGYPLFVQQWLDPSLLPPQTFDLAVFNPFVALPVISVLHIVNNPGVFPAGPAGQVLATQDWLVNGFDGSPLFGGVPPVPGFLRDFDVFNAALPVRTGDRQTRSNAHLLGDGEYRAYGVDGEFSHLFSDVPFLGDVQMVFIAGWDRTRRTQITDLDGTELFILDVMASFEEDLYTSEIRLLSQNEGPLSWIAGFFWFSRERNTTQDTVVSFVTPIAEATQKESGFAPFLSANLEVVQDVELFGGVRWNRDRFFLDRLDPATSIQQFDLKLRADEKFRKTTREVGVRWFITEDHMAYAKFAHGYKAGLLELDISGAVAQLQNGVPENQVDFENVATPELIDAFEAGVRTQWLDGMITANLTGFFYKYTDLQVTQITGAQILTENAGEARVWGVELELVLAPTENWLVMISAGHLDAEFRDFCSDDPFQNLAASEPGCPAPSTNTINAALPIIGKSNNSGNRPEDSPEWNVTFVSRYTIDIGELGSLTPVVEFQWTDDQFARPYNLAIDQIDSRRKIDLRLIWKSVEERYSVELFVENLEDETYYGQHLIGAEYFGGYPVRAGTFPPRIYGVRLGFQWGGKI